MYMCVCIYDVCVCVYIYIHIIMILSCYMCYKCDVHVEYTHTHCDDIYVVNVTHICIYTCTRVLMHVCVYIYIHTHTQTHTHTLYVMASR